jgi:myo-inositol 2-dehydrogenase / D-chiro-inositol 1-dehydrogenase
MMGGARAEGQGERSGVEEVLRYGIIGAGMMGCEHILNLRLLPGAEVTAFADPDAGSREKAREACGGSAAGYTDYRALLREAPVDAVVIATPNHTHAAVLEDVFATDKHVLVEKPLCATV